MNTETAARQLFAIRADGFATRYVYAADRAELAANLARFGDRWGFIIVVSRTGKMHKASPGGPQHCNTRYGGFRTSHTADPRRVRHLAGFPSPFCAKCFGDTFAAALADVVELTADEAATAPAPVAQPEPVVIECAPTWAGLLPVLLELLARGNTEGQRTARDELARMAQAADKWNAHAAAPE
ncbi:MAG: hypothetical protein ACREO4_09235 [Lysobacter sp.]